ncbi:hypothetical protein Drose_12390 [Dactylosporangium roseum]|uniref:Mut7-C ubiquitin/RNAse domain-containing protein n=1 Tax=Dactylosporangium roseum TaxID=47989 RepID=A0ABY5ZA39_9ACTN|nr:Mut7-C ubiquitin/RNAse domain-containing protein [Dactylosporangium roseum]UWZ38948.1 hypothetical protein Drose_12390 [Dactylosporangium roseum]
MRRSTVRVRVAEPLRFLLPVRHRHGDVRVPVDGVSTVRHLVESLGVPRTEIGELLVNGRPVGPEARPGKDDVVDVRPVGRPQRIAEPRFVLDVHLGALARRMRLLGLDVAYRNDAEDAELVAQSAAERRVVLTQDRGLLRRRALTAGAYVHGARADEQLRDVLSRFDPPLTPWSRCPACNGGVEPVAKPEVEHLLEPGTRRSYSTFARCRTCGRVYWRGAHADRLEAVVAAAAQAPDAGLRTSAPDGAARDATACPHRPTGTAR